MSKKHHICVCICTYKRPKHLDGLLWKLEEQETEGVFSYSIVVVDNDISESARLIVESHVGRSKIAISYHVESQQNIALARNKAIENAKGDFVGLIDDDEMPSSRWLLNLFMAINLFKSDGILGPVIPRFEKEPPKWVLKGRFFDRPAHNTGFVLEWKNTRTGNALLRKDLFKEDKGSFNPVFGSGGEDRDFFRRKIAGGHVFIWCEEAPVFEILPPERWRKKVMMKRALIRGKMALNSSESKPMNILISAAAIAIYTIYLPILFVLSPIFGYDVFMKYLIKNCDHLGKILAFFSIDLVREKYVSL
jgi:glycosyltransferase involved in cell wall biosynthesis